jgi:hypothetical protein
MFGSATEFLKTIFSGMFLHLAGNFCHLIYWNVISFTYCLQKRFAGRDCPPQSYFCILLPGREMYLLGLEVHLTQ